MRFVRSRKSYIFISFGLIIALFLFTHWRSYKILVEKSHEERVTHAKDNKLGSHDQLSGKMTQQNCSPESGLQTSAHCRKKDSTALAENITCPPLVLTMEYVTVVMDLMSGRNLQSEKMCYRNITLI